VFPLKRSTPFLFKKKAVYKTAFENLIFFPVKSDEVQGKAGHNLFPGHHADYTQDWKFLWVETFISVRFS
jgi:hypothetical protein